MSTFKQTEREVCAPTSRLHPMETPLALPKRPRMPELPDDEPLSNLGLGWDNNGTDPHSYLGEQDEV